MELCICTPLKYTPSERTSTLPCALLLRAAASVTSFGTFAHCLRFSARTSELNVGCELVSG